MYTTTVQEVSLDDDPVRIYLREVCAVPPLTPAEEDDCSRHILARDSEAEYAGKRLAEAHLALVVSIAEGYRDEGVHMLDLIQKGNDGLLMALETFPGSRAKTFAAHAAACI